jgi:RND family efflux transporter MFP subunit
METGGDVVDVFDTSEMEVIVEAPETVVSRMQVGQPSDLLVNALPGTTIRGEVTAVEPVPDLTNRTFPVHIRVFDPPDALLPGMFVRAAVVTEQPASTVLVSADALIDRGRGTEVWVAAEGLEGLTVQARRIETGRRRGSDIEVLVGLAEGDRVVTAGQDMLFPGASVAIAGEPPAEPMAPGAPAE